jgi:very-short-patch-repair endonuclease
MSPEEALAQLGGVATSRELLARTTRRRLRTALEAEQVVRLTRDSYALPTAQEGLRAAGRVSGVASHLSAAAFYGWKVLEQPGVPQVVVPRDRKVRSARGVFVRYRDVAPEEVRRPGVTEPIRTVLDCARDLFWDAALAVADSALRSDLVDPQRLVEAAATLKGPGSAQARRVAAAADARAHGPFESALRAICLDVPGLRVVPQQEVQLRGRTIHPDLVCEEHRLIIEADSFEWHSSSSALLSDCERYTLAAVADWRVARFGYTHVRTQRGWTLQLLTDLVATAETWVTATSPRGRGTPPRPVDSGQ